MNIAFFGLLPRFRFPLPLLVVAMASIAGCPAPVAPLDAGSTDDAPAGADGSGDGGPRCTTATDCDDGLFCNGEEACTAGRCVAGSLSCDDRVACTVDTCSEERVRCENRAPDADADGYGDASCVDGGGAALGNDCDDGDDTRFPGNPEVCDDVGHDEDCDLSTRGGLDGDGDGHESGRCCNPVAGGGRTCGDDCDDGRRQINPTGTEVCDGLDDDCDGTIDDGVTVTVFEDADRDGHGDPARSRMACAGVGGLVTLGDDCDDTRVDRHPAQLEFCDSIDNDCDGTVDDNTGPVRWFTDTDGDSFGSATSGAVDSCAPIPGASLLGTDCDDARAAINPAAAELCDGRDNDCSGTPDYAIGAGDFEDDDADGYVDIGCGAPLGVDCEDDNPSAGPGEPESCDGRDNDCDTSVDEDVTTYAWFRDADGDGYGTDVEGVVVSCLVIGGHVRRGGDCDDTSVTRNPAAAETCSGRDEDCDGAVDEEPALSSCADSLGADFSCAGGTCRSIGCLPGRGDCDGNATNGCEATLASDAAHCGSCSIACRTAPGAASSCAAGICAPLACSAGRFDCDGDITSPTTNGCELSGTACPVCVSDSGCDDGVLCNGAETCNLGTGVCVAGGGPPDADGDTFTPVACGGTDCDDTRSDVRVGGTEVCDGVDQDCDGAIDDGATDAPTWYRDFDGDGVGDPLTTSRACTMPAGHVASSTDCDDTRVSVRPGAPETCDGLDNDCDALVDGADPGLTGGTTWFRDFDGDGAGDGGSLTVACTMPGGYVSNGSDCDDTRTTVRPGAPEICDGLDNDCDMLTDAADPGITGAATWYRDFDSDGTGNLASTILACTMPTGYVGDSTDCDDTRSSVRPGAPEICDGLDNDCDTLVDSADPGVVGAMTFYRDADTDGAGNPTMPTLACFMPGGFVSNNTDCDDSRPSVRPGAPELCDGLDNDCDTLVDDAPTDCIGGMVCTAGACVAPPRITWRYTWGGVTDDWPVGSGATLDVAADDVGNVYAMGTYGSGTSVGGTSYTAPRFGGVIVALTPAGALRWSTNFAATGSGDLNPVRVIVDPDTGDVLVSGSGWGGNARVGPTTIGTQNGGCTPFVVRLESSTGNVVWGRTYPATQCGTASGVSMTAAGDVLLSGWYQQSLMLDGFMLPGQVGVAQGFVATLDVVTGDAVSAFGFGDPSANEYVNAAAELPGGDVAVAGYYDTGTPRIGTGGPPLPASGSTNAFWGRLTPAGVHVHSGAAAGPNWELLQDLRVGPSGDYYLAGYYDTSTTLGSTTLSGSGYGTILARVSTSSGALTWVTGHTGGGNAFFGLRRITVDALERVRLATVTSYVAGTMFGGLTVPPVAPMASFAHVYTIDGATGAAIRLEVLNANTSYNANGIALTPSGQAVVVGWFNADGLVIDGIPFSSGGARDQYVMLLSF